MLSRLKTSLPLVLTVCQGMFLSVCSGSSLAEETEKTNLAVNSMGSVRQEEGQQATKICAECVNTPSGTTRRNLKDDQGPWFNTEPHATNPKSRRRVIYNSRITSLCHNLLNAKL